MSVKMMGAVFDADLPRDEKYVLLSYADHAAHDGTSIYPSVARMAWKTGYSRRSIQMITTKLVEKGILMPDGKGKHGVNRYRMDISALPEREAWEVQFLHPPAKNDTEGVQKTTPGGADSALNPSLTINDEASKDSGANAPAQPAPPVTPKPSKKKKPTPEGVKVFRENTHRYPAKAWYSDIAAQVGEQPNDLERWGHVVKAWVGMGWNPTNVKGMLEYFGRKEIPPGNGRGQPPVPHAGVLEWLEVQRVEAR